MLNYSTKWINTVVICISIIVTIVLFIILDVIIINPNKANAHKENTMVSHIYMDKKYIKTTNRENVSAIKLNDVMLETMQIADIYENNTNVNNLENNIEENEVNIEEQENIKKTIF